MESSFWNFDSLFQPQSHPARDAHDTFFMKDPENCMTIPEDYYQIGIVCYTCLWIVIFKIEMNVCIIL